jgi:hypothetical protein
MTNNKDMKYTSNQILVGSIVIWALLVLFFGFFIGAFGGVVSYIWLNANHKKSDV